LLRRKGLDAEGDDALPRLLSLAAEGIGGGEPGSGDGFAFKAVLWFRASEALRLSSSSSSSPSPFAAAYMMIFF
jgi:hypothetical protein